MIEQLRRRFILISVSSVFAVLMIISASINGINYLQIGNHANKMLEILSKNDGHFPKPSKGDRKTDLPPKMSPEDPFSTRYFTVKINPDNTIISIDTGKIAAISTSQAVEYVQEVIEEEKTTGLIDTYKYGITQQDYGTLFIFIDCSRDFDIFYAFLLNSIGILLIGILGVFILILAFSKRAIAPIAQSYDKQKRFITDASHELKTPLAIIAANTEVLEMDFGENQWTKSTLGQVDRLSNLVLNLVSLTRMDEDQSPFEMIDFSLSDAVMESAEPFLALCQSQEKSLSLKVEKNISYCGNEEVIRQLVSILLENATKYASSNSEIHLSLKKEGKKFSLMITNKVDHLKKGDLGMLFERFYREDASRNSQTGGYGIGLSIAQAIVHKHKGKIRAQNPDGNLMIITVTL